MPGVEPPFEILRLRLHCLLRPCYRRTASNAVRAASMAACAQRCKGGARRAPQP
ncbi:hypothetical protein HMPREF0004_1012 [Achromobacter piechaudii ATCC 43553]|uniref:Uncharacterized protein n=1 Tax=Achromobacter piechaudii ATCC 43553 TaxID=742159 RepID=D4X6B5_9BURK|nr:hypothetical protein HMPREF0004_1012 [Achromobacter piechaudii ATCC 43553]